jgi:hypothetical protein
MPPRTSSESPGTRHPRSRTGAPNRRVTEALDHLWSDGIPIDAPGAPRLPTPNERKTALVEFWATRTDTAEGAEVQALVRDFLLYEVSESPWPVTDTDRALARGQCHCEPDF